MLYSGSVDGDGFAKPVLYVCSQKREEGGGGLRMYKLFSYMSWGCFIIE